MSFHQTKLANGLTIVGEQRATSACAAIGFFVRTGARDEEPAVSGVSHFLEHMMFKGTEKRSALDITYQLGAIGAQANAFTSEENTVYYVYILPEYFDEAFELLSDMLRPALDEAEFNTEKKVILEEIALYEDRPTFKLYEAAMREFFKDHSAGNSVLGTTESVSGISVEQMRTYFNERYAAGNMTLAVSGNFDWDRVIALANTHCGGWESATATRERAVHVPKQSDLVLRKENLQMAQQCLVTPGPAADDELRYASHVLCCILGDAKGSRAYWELVDNGRAEAVAVDSDDMDGTGMVYAYASARPDVIDDVGETLATILRTAADFSDDELHRAKTKIATRLVLQGESSMRRLMSVGLDWVYREGYRTVEEELDRVQAISRSDIEALLSQFDFNPVTKVTMLPA